MKVTIHYLAQLRRAAGTPREEVELEASASVADLVALAVRLHGDELRQAMLDSGDKLQPAILIFINDEQAGQPARTLLQDGDSVTFLSPIAGG